MASRNMHGVEKSTGLDAVLFLFTCLVSEIKSQSLCRPDLLDKKEIRVAETLSQHLQTLPVLLSR